MRTPLRLAPPGLIALGLLAACTDPRARPVPPVLTVQIAPTFRLTSPGTIAGSLYLFDEDGLFSLHLSVRSDDSTFVGDSLLALSGEPEINRPITWNVPAGLSVGSGVRLAVTVKDYAGFAATDTLHFAIQTAAGGLR